MEQWPEMGYYFSCQSEPLFPPELALTNLPPLRASSPQSKLPPPTLALPPEADTAGVNHEPPLRFPPASSFKTPLRRLHPVTDPAKFLK